MNSNLGCVPLADPPSLWPAWLLAIVMVLIVGALMLQPWWTGRRQARLWAAPFPAPWRRILRRRVPLVARLPTDLQLRLKRHIQVFLAEKTFIGCQGLVITDEMRVTIAAQACLLLLGQTRPDCFPRLRQILVYPGAFVVDRATPLGAGLVQERRTTLAGESWSSGQVILSWSEVLDGGADPADGRNVTLHEFAHQVDQDSGAADGQPWRPSLAQRRRWASVMGKAFEQLRGAPSPLIDAYGASDPAEFFAVLTEVFYERPRELAVRAPAVYRELVDLYRVDPCSW